MDVIIRTFRKIPLKLGLSENRGYNSPVNQNILGQPYLYFGFLPIISASNREVQGVQVNGVDITFTNCDSNPNNYIALFPNFSGLKPSDYLAGTNWDFSNQVFSNTSKRPVGRRPIPNEFFTFAEIHFGGCGCYSQTDRKPNDIVAIAIGFK